MSALSDEASVGAVLIEALLEALLLFCVLRIEDKGIALLATIYHLTRLLLVLARTYVLLLKLFLRGKLAHLLLEHELLHLLLG